MKLLGQVWEVQNLGCAKTIDQGLGTLLHVKLRKAIFTLHFLGCPLLHPVLAPNLHKEETHCCNY